MPKLAAKLKPLEQQKIEDRLRGFYGGGMSRSDICREIGVKNYETVSDWLVGLPYIKVGRRKYWRTDSVAEKMYREMEIYGVIDI